MYRLAGAPPVRYGSAPAGTRQETGSRPPLLHRLPAGGRNDAPILPLATPGHLVVAKDVHPAMPRFPDTAHVLEACAAHRVCHHRIGEMAPGALPFRVL